MLTKREKVIAVTLVAIAGVSVLMWRVVKPQMETRDKIAADIRKAEGQLSDMRNMADLRPALTEKWDELTKPSPNGSLQTDQSVAQTQAVQAIEKWAAERRVSVEFSNIVSLPPMGDFAAVDITLKAKGSDPHIIELIYLMETAKFPLRISNVQITPVKEGLRDVVATINVTTVSYKEPAKKPAVKG